MFLRSLRFSLFAVIALAAIQISSVSFCRAVDPDPFETVHSSFYAQIDYLTDHAWSLARKAPDSALYYADKAASLSRKHGVYAKGLINAHTLLGILNKDRGYFEIAVEHYIEAMQLAEAEGDSLRVSGCLNNLGVVASRQRNFTKALYYFQRSLKIENELGTDRAQASIRLYNIGEAYEKLDSLDEAYAYYYNSLLIEEELEYKEGIFYARLGIGKVDSKNGNYVKAKEELGQALFLAQELEDNPGICESRLAFGELYSLQKLYPAALIEFQAALEKAREFKSPSLEMDVLQGISQVSRELGNLNEALDYLEKYYQIREDLNSSKVNSRIGELQAQYELEKKEQEIRLLQKEDALKERERGYDRKVRNYLIFTVGIMIFLTLSLTLFNIYQGRKRPS